MYKVYFIFQGLERTSQALERTSQALEYIFHDLEYKKVMVIKKISA